VCCKFLESRPFLLGFIDFFFLFLILLGGQLGCLLEIFHLLRNACITMNFALRTAFATSHKVLYGCVFIDICGKIFISLLHTHTCFIHLCFCWTDVKCIFLDQKCLQATIVELYWQIKAQINLKKKGKEINHKKRNC